MATNLEEAIFRTAAYFDYFSYPLTSFEVWKWLLGPARQYTLLEVCNALQTSELLRKTLTHVHGMYGFGDVEAKKNDRAHRFMDAVRKYAVLSPYVRYLSRIRAIKGVAVCNSLAFHHTLPTSDIDLFIVTEKGRTWTARFFAALPLIFLRRRPGEVKEHALCLSFFAAESALAFEPLKIGEEDPYLAYWSLTLIPLFDRIGWQRQFHEENHWVRDMLPNARPVKRSMAYKESGKRVTFPSCLSELLLKKVQEERFPEHIRIMKNIDTRVVIRDNMLKFHDRDRREEIHYALRERMKAIV